MLRCGLWLLRRISRRSRISIRASEPYPPRPPVRAAPFLHAQRGRPRHRGADRTNMEEQQVAPMAVHQIRDSKVKGSESVPTGGYGVDDLELVWSGGGAVERHAGARPRSRASKPTAGHVLSTYRITGATSVGIVLVTMTSYWSKASVSRAWVGLTWLLVLLFILALRWMWQAYQERLKADGRLTFRTLIVGTTAEATRLAQILKAPASGFAPLGYVATSDPSVPANSLPVVGNVADLRRLVREHAADCLFVASTSIGADDMSRVAQAARQEGIELRVSANLSQTLTSRLALHNVGGAITLSLRPVRLSGTQVVLKRTFDLVVASTALIVSLPLWAVIGVAIRLTSRGSVFFRQERVTKGGCVFWMYKFRTMRTDVEHPADTTAPFFKLHSDPRQTRVGRIIRCLSLDELPQLLNVLKGEMSVVGPRPLPTDQVAANLELLSPRQEVWAGLTGWWQINGRSAVTPEEAVRLDAFYIENWSLTLDLYIVLKTFGAVVSRRGAS